MFPIYFNGRLITAVVAVALSASFFYEPSFPRRIQESGHEIQIFEKIMKKENDLSDKKMMNLYSAIFTKNKDQDGFYWGAQGVGVVLGWRAAELYGGRSVLIHGNVFRFFGVLLHFGELAYRTYYPLSRISSPSPLSADEDPISCECGPSNFGEKKIVMKIKNMTTTVVTVTTVPLQSESTHTVDKPRKTSKQYISIWSKCLNGLYSGMSTFVGIFYLYEITPKGTKVHSISALAFYFMMTTTIKYTAEIGISPPVIYQSKADACPWVTSGLLTLVAMVIQVVLLKRFCSESPSFLLHQKKDKEKAKKALIKLRETDQVDQELELLEKRKGQRDPVIRSSLIMIMYITLLIYNYAYTFHGILNAVSLGIPLKVCVNIYYIVNIMSFLLPVMFYKNLYLITIRNVLIYYYTFLGSIYFINSTMISGNVQYGTDVFNNRQTIAAFVVAMTLLMHILFCSGLGLFSIVLMSEYSSQVERQSNIILAGMIATSFCFGGLYIFLSGILIFYNFNPMPWVYLGLLIWIVSKYEMTMFGLAPTKDRFTIFQVCFKFDSAPKKGNKSETKA